MKKHAPGRRLLKLLAALLGLYGVLFSVFYWDLDSKLIYYGLLPVLDRHYDSLPRKDFMKRDYPIS